MRELDGYQVTKKDQFTECPICCLIVWIKITRQIFEGQGQSERQGHPEK